MSIAETEVRFRVRVQGVPPAHLEAAERKAEEAFVLALLRCGDVSAQRAAELLGVNRWDLGELMSLHGASPQGAESHAGERGSGSPAADAEEAKANAASIALLRSWLEEDATDDPEEIRKAQGDLDEFKRAINAERERAGARRIYP